MPSHRTNNSGALARALPGSQHARHHRHQNDVLQHRHPQPVRCLSLAAHNHGTVVFRSPSCPPCYVTRVRKLCIPLRSVAETCVRRARVGGRSACLLLVAWQRQLEGARAAVARAARTVALLLVLLVRRGGMRVRARAPVAWAARSVRVAGSVRVGGGQKARRAARASAAGEVRDEGHRGRRARGDGAAQRQRALDKGEGLPTRGAETRISESWPRCERFDQKMEAGGWSGIKGMRTAAGRTM